MAHGFIDPKDYPFKSFCDKYKHQDTDESRHLIQPIHHIIDKDFKGQEHLYCDKEQLCPLGKYRRPKKLIEAESRGFASVAEMDMADKKAEEDKKVQEVDDLKKQVASLEKKAKEDAQQKEIDDLKKQVASLAIVVPNQEVDDLKKQLETLTTIIEKIPAKYRGV